MPAAADKAVDEAVTGGSGSECSEVRLHRSVDWQTDGLPRLPTGLAFDENYSAEAHCPVCSLDEGERHKPGVASHAAAHLSVPRPTKHRSIDRCGMALLRSLRRPIKTPRWWGSRHAHKQRSVAELLESSTAHYIVIGLTLVDLAVVVTELILTAIFACHEHEPHAVHTAEEALRWTSVGILCLFTAELAVRLAVFGHTYFTHSRWHLFDAVVVISSLVLELSLHNLAQEVASLLVFFRLWRVLRVMHGVAEAIELNHESELSHHHRLVHGLQQDLADEQRHVQVLQRQLQSLSLAAAQSGVDVSEVLRLVAAAASPPAGSLGGLGRPGPLGGSAGSGAAG
ncbi:hypothetical protein D9Q98_001887 [Chlorella vulgaris]|uniref:Voltage-gated hydrogen channel 1 n=1 Tax=Chlorella vulgaris TaxID=3077 RepID=A0A9D4TVF6_CHLVU|nr:hypothetical protein D9Q98_001887 [Chlorella vulgaris]